MPPVSDAAQLNSESPHGDLILAIDTGGTKTAAWIVELASTGSHRLLGQARTTGGNPLSVGFEKATEAIHAVFVAAHHAAQLGDRRATRAIFSIAGAANRDMADRFVAWARSVGFADRIAIVSDILPILAAGTPDCCGVALIAGTGSSAFGRAADGRTKRCGGWGFLLGDEGSGYAIGRAALQHTLRNLEAGTLNCSLTKAVLGMLAVKSVTELTRTVYSNTDARHAIAALATVVCIVAENDDEEAKAILHTAAVDLAELVVRTADAVGVSDSGLPLALSGGLLINSRLLQIRLQDQLHERNLNCTINIVSEPLDGCVRLADPACAKGLVNWHVCN